MGMITPGLSETLFSKSQRGVLGLLFGNPGRSFYANEIVRHVDAGIGSVQRELERLAASGLLTVKRIGNQKHYQANRRSPIFAELEGIVQKIFEPAPAEARAAPRPLALHEKAARYVVARRAQPPAVPKRELAAFCRRHHVKRLGVFGSTARGEMSDTSDVDVLVEFEDGAREGLFDMVRMRDELSRLFGRKVDLATPAILENPYRRSSILKDLRELYAA